MESNVSAFYVQLVEDVINKARGEFIASGAGEGVLDELQALWEAKMMQSGIVDYAIEHICDQIVAGPIIGLLDPNVPHEGPAEEFELTVEMLFPPTPSPTPLPETPLTQLPGIVDQLIDNVPKTPSDCAPSPISDQPSASWMKQRPLGLDINAAYFESDGEINRGAPQNTATQDISVMSSRKGKSDDTVFQEIFGSYLPQQDGSVALESFEQEINLNLIPSHRVASDYYNTPGHHVGLQDPDPDIGTSQPSESEAVEDEELPLNEEDDDHDDSDDSDELEPGENLVLAQFKNVTRSKNRWKCSLKDVIMLLHGREILFSKATGEFVF